MNSILKKRYSITYFVVITVVLIFSGKTFAQVNLCNDTGKQIRVARITLNPKNVFDFSDFSCSGISLSGCYASISNFYKISPGYCKNFAPSNNGWIYFAVQEHVKAGRWRSPIYSKDKLMLSGRHYGSGSTGMSDASVCVKNNYYSIGFDRKIKGTIDAVNTEKCKAGYSKVPVNLFVQVQYRTNFTLTLN